jgi:hypothetical protein
VVYTIDRSKEGLNMTKVTFRETELRVDYNFTRGTKGDRYTPGEGELIEITDIKTLSGESIYGIFANTELEEEIEDLLRIELAKWSPY